MRHIVDFHSHILPGIDDGSKNLQESLRMMRLSAQQGIRHMVATPHFYPRYDSPETFLRKREEAADKLRKAMVDEPDLPEISIGAEVYFFSGISDSELIKALTIEGKRCILIEMPQSPWKESHYRELEGIYIKNGITPIVAHIDRYIRPFHTHGIPERLEQMPVLVQANAEFFLRSSTRNMAMKMLKKDRIHLLGSDCHNLSSRSPDLGDAVELIEQKLGENALAGIQIYQDDVLNSSLIL